MKLESLAIGSYEFVALLNTGSELFKIDGHFSVYWEGYTPKVKIDSVYDSDSDISILNDKNLVSLLQEEIEDKGNAREWYKDYQLAMEDINWDT
jgi:hypothetical protein